MSKVTGELRAMDTVATATEGVVGGDDPSVISKAGPITGVSQGPSVEDQRELVPDQGLSSRVEAMLSQVIEENRVLRRRLEQAELHSHSSWHSGLQGEPGVGMSPVSFTTEGVPRFGESVQAWPELGRFVGFPPGSMNVPIPTSVSGPPRRDEMVGCSAGNGVLVSGEQQFLDAHRLRNMSANATGLGGIEWFGYGTL